MLLLLQLITLMEVLLAAAASAQTTAATLSPPSSDQVEVKPGCQDKCGKVSIPYPFGTTPNCYYNEDFFINCTGNPPKPFLRKSDSIEVTNISVDGKLDIEQYIAIECFNKSGARLAAFDNSLSLSKFVISDTDNKFVAVGCDTYAEIIGDKNGAYGYTGGCTTKCGKIDYVANDSCSGIGCCQTSIAKGMTSFEVSVNSFENHTKVWDFSPCSYAFVVEEGKFNFSPNMLKDLEYVELLPVVLDWSIGNETCEEVENKKLMNYTCQNNSRCHDVDNGFGYRCKCLDGYHGNPYLNGCLGKLIVYYLCFELSLCCRDAVKFSLASFDSYKKKLVGTTNLHNF